MRGCKGILVFIFVVMAAVIGVGSVIAIREAVNWFNANPMALGGLIAFVVFVLVLIAGYIGSTQTRKLMREGADIALQGREHRAASHKAMATMGGAVARMFTGKQEQSQLPPPSSWEVQSQFPMVTDAQFEDVGNNDEPIA